MKIKCVSFSRFETNLKSYVFTKLDLFEFLFTQIILKDNLDKNTKLVEALNALDIKEDLFYLFNNVYYKFKDNGIIECNFNDIYDVSLKDIKVNSLFIEPLTKGKFPLFSDSVNKEFCYDYLNKKIVTYKDNFEDSNVLCFEVLNKESVESIINRFSSALFNSSEGIYLVDSFIADPYYFEVELNEENNVFVYKRSNKEELYDSLVNNSLFINDERVKGEYLSNNIYFDVCYGKENIKDNTKYLFINDSEKEGEVKDNIIYVNYNFLDGDFIDLVNKEKYKCGVYKLENEKNISTFIKSKEDKVSDFKLYLIKNKNKFRISLNEILELI